MKKIRFLLFMCSVLFSIMTRAEIASGNCGTNLKWTLSDDYTLTISGTGPMWNYSNSKTFPSWNNYKYDIVKVNIEEGMTSIGNYAFYCCSALSSITIPNTLTSIGDRAFEGCQNLTSISLPNSLSNIGSCAFNYCLSLTSINLSNDNPNYCIENNTLFNKNKTELVYCFKLETNSYSIPNTVVSIGDGAFDECDNLISITIPNSVTAIGGYAFNDCSNLTSVSIPNSVTDIGEGAFRACSGLNSVNIGSSVTRIGDYAFFCCFHLSSITIPNSVAIIGKEAFNNCSDIRIIHMGNSVHTIGNKAFSACSNIEIVYWDTNLPFCSFVGSCLKEIYYGDEVLTINTNYSFNKYYLNKVVLGKNVEKIQNASFSDATRLREFYIKSEKDISVDPNVFLNANLYNSTLYVPKSKLEHYKTTSPWYNFGTIKTLEGTEFEDETIDINDNCNQFIHSQEQEKTIKYSRNFTNSNWQSLYVPFSMSYDDWKDEFEVAYINYVRQYDDDEDGNADRTEIEVFKMKEGKSIEPNTPYLIKAKTTGEKTITLENATLYKTDENTYDVTSWFTRFNFIGTYHTISNMASNGYYAMSDGALMKATSDAVTLQPFRWYLYVTDRNGNPVPLNSKSMSIVFDDGETTGIETISNEAKESTSIHTLTGISKGNDTKALAPGIYIKNGKKFIIK